MRVLRYPPLWQSDIEGVFMCRLFCEQDERVSPITRKTYKMAQRTFTVEIRVDYDNKEKDEAFKEYVVEIAKQMFTQSLLIADKRPPELAVHESDHFNGRKRIEVNAGQ